MFKRLYSKLLRDFCTWGVLHRIIVDTAVFALFILPMPLGNNANQVAQAASNTACTLTWNVVPSPNGGTKNNSLGDLAIVSPNDIWAVGTAGDDNDILRTLIEHWDGQNWSMVPSPNMGAGSNLLMSISAISANDIWAAGYNYENYKYQPLIEHWDGTTWSVVQLPGDLGNTYLHGIKAVSTNEAWVVGGHGDPKHPLLMRWDGVTWKRIPILEPNPPYGELNDLVILAPDDIWAVGGTTLEATPPEFHDTLVLHFDGSNWTRIPSPNLYQGNHDNELWSVAALSHDDIWTVGRHLRVYAGSIIYELLEHWDGIRWTVIPGAITHDGFATLMAVAAAATNNVWAVGSYRYAPLIEHWDGNVWTQVKVNMQDGHLYSILIAGTDNVWAVGQQNTMSSQRQTLILHGILSAPRSPRLLSPAPGATSSDRRVLLMWDSLPCATRYQLVLKQDSAHGKRIARVSKLTIPEYNTQPLIRGKTYVWRVRACNSVGCSAWSKWRTFSINSESNVSIDSPFTALR